MGHVACKARLSTYSIPRAAIVQIEHILSNQIPPRSQS